MIDIKTIKTTIYPTLHTSRDLGEKNVQRERILSQAHLTAACRFRKHVWGARDQKQCVIKAQLPGLRALFPDRMGSGWIPGGWICSSG